MDGQFIKTEKTYLHRLRDAPLQRYRHSGERFVMLITQKRLLLLAKLLKQVLKANAPGKKNFGGIPYLCLAK
jgi:hypothetical protein